MPTRITGVSIAQLAVATASIATEASITATSSATADVAITCGPAGYEAGNYQVVSFIPYITKGTTNIDVELFLDGVISQTMTGHLAASVVSPTTFTNYVALTAGVHTFTVRAFVDGGTGKVGANNGATGNAPNARVWVIPA